MKSKYNSIKEAHPFFELAIKYVKDTIKSVNIEWISWTGVANKLKGRTMIDCKNKFMQFFEYVLKCSNYDNMKIVEFIDSQNI